MSNFKKIAIGVIFIGIVAGLTYALYFVFFKPATPPTAPAANANANVPGAGLPGAGPGVNIPYVPPPTGAGALAPASTVARGGPTVTTVVAATDTEGARLSADGQTVRYYDRLTGKFMIVDKNGNARTLSDEFFPNVQAVTWSGDGDKAILEFPDGSKLSYNFAAKKQATLPSGWEDFSFSPGSDRIAAKSLAESPDNQYLVTANADGTGARAIEPMGDNAYKVQVAWSPSGDVLAFSETGDPIGFDIKQMLFVGERGENFPATEVKGLGFLPLWSPDGDYLLYSAANSDDDFKPRLWVVAGSGNERGTNRRAINLYTLASKCTFANATTVYCAVPYSMPEGAGLSPEIISDIPDSIYKVNVATGMVTLVGQPDTDTTIERLTVSSDGSVLYFVDGANGNIKKMMLK